MESRSVIHRSFVVRPRASRVAGRTDDEGSVGNASFATPIHPQGEWHFPRHFSQPLQFYRFPLTTAFFVPDDGRHAQPLRQIPRALFTCFFCRDMAAEFLDS